MKLATILHQGRETVSVVDTHDDVYWPLSDAVAGLPERIAHEMVAAIAHFGGVATVTRPAAAGYSLVGARVLAPIPVPSRNIMCVGKNYHAHAHEFTKSGFDAGAKGEEAIPEHPIIFTKPSSSIVGPGDVIPLWEGLDAAVDYEAELAVVIGRGGRAISRAQALTHVFGYTILNDVTARDLQRQHKQWFLGKGIDGFGPMGPWIVTADEIDGGTGDHVPGEWRNAAEFDDGRPHFRYSGADREHFQKCHALPRRRHRHGNAGRRGHRLQPATLPRRR